MNIKEMTNEELEAELLENRCALRATKDLEEKRRLVSKGHDLMLEMDRRRMKQNVCSERGGENSGEEPRPVS